MAVTCVSIVNIWLAVQNARWLMYSPFIRNLLPHVDRYARFDITLELPGILIGLLAVYVLIFRFALNIWGIRYSMFRDALSTRILSINSLLLAILTAVAIYQWMNWYHILPYDVIAVSFFGAVAAIVSYFLERKLSTAGQFTLTRFSPSRPLGSLASMWRKSRLF
jgi:hypothetical protein